MEKEYLQVELIRCDGGTQSRLFNDKTTINEYKELMLSGHEFDPVTVFFDGTDYWLADGFHRVIAARDGEIQEVAADVKAGTRRDAILFSAGANSKHGLKRNSADKRRAVKMLLDDEEWSAWSQGDIAKACGVSREFVNRVAQGGCDRSQPVKGRDGKTYPAKKARPVTDAPPSPNPQNGEVASNSPQSKSSEEEIIQPPPTPEEQVKEEEPSLESELQPEKTPEPTENEPSNSPLSPNSLKELNEVSDITDAHEFLRYAIENKSQLRYDADLLSEYLRRAAEIQTR